jgi:hypothetical protein
MKASTRGEKWGSALLGIVSLALLFNLVENSRDVRAGAPHPLPANPAEQRALASNRKAGEDERFQSQLHLDVLDDLDARPLPDIDRNPFEFGVPKLTPRQIEQAKIQEAQKAVAQNQPTPPPAVALKVLGFGEKVDGSREAYLSDEDQIYVVHEGEPVGSRFKVMKIQPTFVEIQDAAANQTIQLPIPQ